MGMADGGPEFFPNGQPMRAGAMGPNPVGPNGQGNHALQDYQMQLMLLEQQNKKRLLMARQEQDGPQVGFAPNLSPSNSRGGHSPGPGGEFDCSLPSFYAGSNKISQMLAACVDLQLP